MDGTGRKALDYADRKYIRQVSSTHFNPMNVDEPHAGLAVLEVRLMAILHKRDHISRRLLWLASISDVLSVIFCCIVTQCFDCGPIP